MINALVFPSSFFDKRLIDEDLKREYDAAVNSGLYDHIFIFGYEDWFHENRLKLNYDPSTKVTAAYRGWMMQPEQYLEFYQKLSNKNIELVTTPEEYSLFHIFPNIYPQLCTDTPRMITYPLGTAIEVDALKNVFSKFMIKDYVKSVKGTEFPAFFESNVTQKEFDHWMKVFHEYRGDLFTGGICVKEFVELKKYGEHKNEHRVFYINNEIATINRNSGQPQYCPVPPDRLIEKYKDLKSNFYTIDFAELITGEWIIIEAGDGSVSGLSDYQDYTEFFRKLYYCFK